MTSILGLKTPTTAMPQRRSSSTGSSWRPPRKSGFNRVKHVAGFPSLAAAWCLAEAGVSPEDLDHIAVLA